MLAGTCKCRRSTVENEAKHGGILTMTLTLIRSFVYYNDLIYMMCGSLGVFLWSRDICKYRGYAVLMWLRNGRF